MQCVVMKFGGVLLENRERIHRAAEEIVYYTDLGYSVAAIVSAMGNYTDRYQSFADLLSIEDREHDRLLSYGENIAASVLAGHLCSIGVKAKSFTGEEAGITVENRKIKEINGQSVKECLNTGIVAVISGFQGVDSDGEIRVLNRGGSDTTAVHMAKFLSAEKLILYKDVGGIYTSDPKKFKRCSKIKEITYKEMLRLAENGCGVISADAIEDAEKFGVEITVTKPGMHTGFSKVGSYISHG